MGIGDEITGKAKQAAGDVTDSAGLRQEGKQEQQKGEAKEDLAEEQERTEEKADEVADLERKTD